MNSKKSFLNPLISHYILKHPIDWSEQFLAKEEKPLDVEIGFGMGEVLVRQAAAFPDRRFIGIEQIWERIYKTLQRIRREDSQIDNVKILSIDAWIAFERLFSLESIDRIYSFFPCPWPKKKHIKHRLFSTNFLNLLNSRIKSNGELRIVTDAEYYFHWIVEQAEDTGFTLNTDKIKPQFDTKFERKWCQEGHEEFFEINLYKTEHKYIPVKEDVELKAYMVEQFNPDNFVFQDFHGEVSVVFKEFLFDARKQKGMVLLLVAEQNLTQNVRVTIMKRNKGWRICKADGQVFFPTSGIAKAIELVYKTVISEREPAL